MDMAHRFLCGILGLHLVLVPGSSLHGQQTPGTVSLVIEQDYGEARTFKLPLERLARQALAGAGLQVSTTASDALVIRLHGIPGVRHDTAAVAHYVEATVEGEVLARGPGVRETFRGEQGPVSSFVTPTMQVRPEDAPFAGALSRSNFVPVLGRVIAAWGVRPASIHLAILQDPEELYQQSAVRALGELKDPAATAPLIEKLKRTDRFRPGLQLALVEAMEAIGDRRAVEPLIAVLTDLHGWDKAREASVRALAHLGDRRATLPLANALKSTAGWTFQRELLKALESLGDKRAIGPLATQLASRGNRPKAYDSTLESLEQGYDKDLADLLGKLSGQDFGLDGARWVAWWNQNQKALSAGP